MRRFTSSGGGRCQDGVEIFAESLLIKVAHKVILNDFYLPITGPTFTTTKKRAFELSGKMCFFTRRHRGVSTTDEKIVITAPLKEFLVIFLG